MLLDKNGKIKGKVSIVDISIVLIIALVIVGIYFRYNSKVTSFIKSDKTFEYVVKIENIRGYTVDALNKKGAVTNKKSEINMGEIVDVKVVPSSKEGTKADGTIVNSEVPDYYTCFVTVKAHGKESNDNYTLDDTTELSVGSTINLYSKYVKTSGTVLSVDVL